MPICHHCKSQLSKTAKHCPICGEKDPFYVEVFREYIKDYPVDFFKFVAKSKGDFITQVVASILWSVTGYSLIISGKSTSIFGFIISFGGVICFLYLIYLVYFYLFTYPKRLRKNLEMWDKKREEITSIVGKDAWFVLSDRDK